MSLFSRIENFYKLVNRIGATISRIVFIILLTTIGGILLKMPWWWGISLTAVILFLEIVEYYFGYTQDDPKTK